MCGRYNFSKEALLQVKTIIYGVKSELRSFYGDIYPTNTAPVIISDSNGLLLDEQFWGYVGKGKTIIFNARAESVYEKYIFFNGIHRHRAVIPASCFYEWNRIKEKSTFYRKDSPVLYMAGFFDFMDSEERFVILTTKANASVQSVHDRMPLILESNQIEEWISDEKAAKSILKQTPAQLERETEYEQQSLFDI